VGDGQVSLILVFHFKFTALTFIGRYIDLFEEHYMQICIDAFNKFSETLWPCSYVNRRKGHCVNVKNRHNKGHQNEKGQVMNSGQYEHPKTFSTFRDAWIDFIKVRVEQTGKRIDQEVPAGMHVPKGSWANEIHRREIQPSYRRLGQAEAFKNHLTCFCCLREMPEHPLPCGHVLCERCVVAHGREKDQNTIEIKNCPLEGSQFPTPWHVRSKPVNAGVRILSLDGGGIRGIVELEALLCIEELFDSRIPIQRFFDLIVGTSTGGIIALGLGVKQWRVEECIRWYQKLSKEAFTAKPLSGPRMMSTRYKARPLEQVLEQAFQQKYLFGGSQDNAGSYFTKVAVTASTDTGQQPCLFANYNRPDPSGQVYRFIRQDSTSREMRVWEAYVSCWPHSNFLC
jgi:hypothetical protein